MRRAHHKKPKVRCLQRLPICLRTFQAQLWPPRTPAWSLCSRLSKHSMMRVLAWIMLVFRQKVAVHSVSPHEALRHLVGTIVRRHPSMIASVHCIELLKDILLLRSQSLNHSRCECTTAQQGQRLFRWYCCMEIAFRIQTVPTVISFNVTKADCESQ